MFKPDLEVGIKLYKLSYTMYCTSQVNSSTTVYVESFNRRKFHGFCGFRSDHESFPAKVWTRVHDFHVIVCIEMALLKYLKKRSTSTAMAPQKH